MAATTSNPKDRTLLAVIGDEDSITGLLLAGIGHINQQQKKNFLIVDSKTQTSVIEAAFNDFTERKDIAILLINQHIAERIRPAVDRYQAAFPALLEIPSKEHPYGELLRFVRFVDADCHGTDPAKDSVLKRVQKLRGD
ncbi:V-type H+-transporting ATPase subunit F, partial [Tremellales sp. Uapishka_1]